MEDNFKESEEYKSYLEWIQKVREHRDANKFQLGGQVNQLQMNQQLAALQIDRLAEQLLDTMPQVKDQLAKMSNEDIYRLGESYIKKMGESNDENYQTFVQYFQINPIGTTKLLIALMTKAQSELNPHVSRSLRVARPAAQMNVPPSAFGRKGFKIMQMNGHCPEGYEVVSYGLGGCVKCRKAKLKRLQELLIEDMKCGGKKRIKKGANGEILLKKGGKSLTKTRANALKYKGGPGDIDSTQGMKPNKKQRRMLTKKVKGGMVRNAKKITIYSQPDMFDVIH